MYLSKDDDGTLALHENFPRKIIVNGFVAYTSDNMIILNDHELEFDGVVEVDICIK